jgi:sarcosine oxidase subunit gamma
LSGPILALREQRERLGLKGPRAAEWLATHGIGVPTEPNTWTDSAGNAAPDALLVARLGTGEFFLEEGVAGSTLGRIALALDGQPPGVYPVLREDWAFHLHGEGVHDVLAQVCNVNFSALPLDSNPVIMTLMIGVAVLVVPQIAPRGRGVPLAAGPGSEHRYKIWCDPTFGTYLAQSLGAVVTECGGSYRGESA